MTGGGLPGLIGINSRILAHWFSTGDHGLLGVYDRLVDGALSSGSVLALGIMPYLSARVFRWLGGKVSARVAAMEAQREGRFILRAGTRALTVALSLIQSYGFARFAESIPGVVPHPGAAFVLQTMIVLTTGASVMLWIGENATESTAMIELLGEAPRVDAPRPTSELLLPLKAMEPLKVRTPAEAFRVRMDTPV